MLKILIVEDDAQLATTLKYLVEDNPRYRVVARVVINRAASGLYPSSWCGVVKQKAQFSFVRGGRFPRIDVAGEAWRKAQAIARIAVANASDMLPTDVLWYHADYVAPSWGRRLTRVDKIGAHIFYRS